MKDHIDEIKKIFKKKEVTDIKQANEIISKYIADFPYFKKNIKAMIKCRGSVIDMAIKLELGFNQIINLSDKPSFMYADFKKKAGFIKKIIRIIDVKKYFQKDFYKKLDTLVNLRNLFAHVPIDVFKEELTFQTESPYDKYFEKDINLSKVKNSIKEFSDICVEIQKNLVLVQEMIVRGAQRKGGREPYVSTKGKKDTSKG